MKRLQSVITHSREHKISSHCLSCVCVFFIFIRSTRLNGTHLYSILTGNGQKEKRKTCPRKQKCVQYTAIQPKCGSLGISKQIK